MGKKNRGNLQWNPNQSMVLMLVYAKRANFTTERRLWTTFFAFAFFVHENSFQNNRLLPSSKNPHFQNEAKCSTFLVKMSFICMRLKMIWALNLVWYRGPGELGNGILTNLDFGNEACSWSLLVWRKQYMHKWIFRLVLLKNAFLR